MGKEDGVSMDLKDLLDPKKRGASSIQRLKEFPIGTRIVIMLEHNARLGGTLQGVNNTTLEIDVIRTTGGSRISFVGDTERPGTDVVERRSIPLQRIQSVMTYEEYTDMLMGPTVYGEPPPPMRE